MTNSQRVDALYQDMIEGWLNGGGKAPSLQAALKARRWVKWLPKGYIYPTPEGGLLYEYDLKHWCVSIDFEANGMVTIMGTQTCL